MSTYNPAHLFILPTSVTDELIDWLNNQPNPFEIKTIYDSEVITMVDDRWIVPRRLAERIMVIAVTPNDAVYFKLRWSDHLLYDSPFDNSPPGILFL